VTDPVIIVDLLLDHEHTLAQKQGILTAYAVAINGPTFDDLITTIPTLFKTIPTHDRRKARALSFVIETIIHENLNVNNDDTIN